MFATKPNRCILLLQLTIFFMLLVSACRANPAPTATRIPAISPIAPTPTITPANQSLASPTYTLPAPSPTSQPTQSFSTEVQPTPSPTQAPDQNPTPQSPVIIESECKDVAAFYGDVTVPDDTFFSQGEPFVKTWRLRNAGDCTWTTDYKLVHYSGEIMSAGLSIPFPKNTAPGETIDISVDMVAPSRGGPHQSNWWFEKPSGERFGAGLSQRDLIWVAINVRHFTAEGQPQGNPAEKPTPAPVAGCTAQPDATVSQQVLVLINEIRAQNGLNLLSMNLALNAAALRHSRDMACNRFVDHAGSDGTSWYDRIRAEGYSFSNANENIYVGFPEFGGTAQGAVTWWMNSQVHRDNILKPDNTEAGVGYVYDPNSEWGGYYTMVFARP